jgi:tRNA A-37 threonylcarbamoyl transferase component Bud32
MSNPSTPARSPQAALPPPHNRMSMPAGQHLTIPTSSGTTTPVASPNGSQNRSTNGTNNASPASSPLPATKSNSSSASSGQPSTKTRKVGKYALGKTLGQGTFGKVKFATDTETGKHYAIKMLDKAKIRANNMGEQIKKEISIMKLIKHPSVIQLIEVLASATTIYIVLELVTGGELFDKIIASGCFAEAEAREYFHQLVNGISACHSLGVAHRDLKPENLLLDEKGNLKISDFGLSALAGESSSGGGGDLLHTTCGQSRHV